MKNTRLSLQMFIVKNDGSLIEKGLPINYQQRCRHEAGTNYLKKYPTFIEATRVLIFGPSGSLLILPMPYAYKTSAKKFFVNEQPSAAFIEASNKPK